MSFGELSYILGVELPKSVIANIVNVVHREKVFGHLDLMVEFISGIQLSIVRGPFITYGDYELAFIIGGRLRMDSIISVGDPTDVVRVMEVVASTQKPVVLYTFYEGSTFGDSIIPIGPTVYSCFPVQEDNNKVPPVEQEHSERFFDF